MEITEWINTALLPIVGMLLKLVVDMRKESRETNETANEAKESADKAANNTQNVSNGFASTVLGELHKIREDQQELSSQMNEHLAWHLKKGE